MHADIRHDWTVDEALALLEAPLLDLLHRAQAVHRAHNADDRIQLASLLSIKTGGCPEDCKYCDQSARDDTDFKAQKLMEKNAVLETTRAARAPKPGRC